METTEIKFLSCPAPDELILAVMEEYEREFMKACAIHDKLMGKQRQGYSEATE